MATTDIGRVTPIWRGFYSAATTYELNDLVIDNSGSVWWHKSEDQTTGVAPVAGEIWDAVIDMSEFSGLIQAAITTAQTALAAAQAALADVATDMERAETAAQNAENSATAASESAAGVGALAQAAAASAAAAEASETSASGSATSAAGSAEEAEAWATGGSGGTATATNNAKYYSEQSSASATSAASSASAAQDVLDSIPEDYSQLSEDVSDLKTQIYSKFIDHSTYIQGTPTAPTNTTRCTTGKFECEVGDTIKITGNASGQKFALASDSGLDSGWQTDEYTYTVTTISEYFVNIARADGTSAISPSDITSLKVTVYVSRVSDLESDVDGLESAVDDLSTQLNAVNSGVTDGLAQYGNDMFSQGDWSTSTSATKVNSTKAIRIDNPITIHAGDKLITKPGTKTTYMGWNLWDANGEKVETGYEYVTYKRTIQNKTITFAHDGTLEISVANGPNPGNSSAITPDDMDAVVIIQNSLAKRIEVELTDYEDATDDSLDELYEFTTTEVIDETPSASEPDTVIYYPYHFKAGQTYIAHIKFTAFSSAGNRKYSLRTTTGQYISSAYTVQGFAVVDGTNPVIGEEYVYKIVAKTKPDGSEGQYLAVEINSESGELSEAELQVYSIKAEDAQTELDKLDYITATDIVSLNHDLPMRIAEGNKPLMNATTYPLKLLHFSDIHGDATNLQRIVDLKNHLGAKIDDTICTGDMVYNNYSATCMDFWDGVDGAENILMVVGNHELADGQHGYGSDQIGQTLAYEKYISPYVSNWNVTLAGSNLTYWVKDYAARKVRLIGLNYLLTGDELTAQNTWLAERLSEAKAAGYAVVIAEHCPGNAFTNIDCGFSVIGYPWTYNEFPVSIQETVQTFIDGGGEFACYLCGHSHRDYVGYNSNFPNQLFIVVTCAFPNATSNDMYRAVGTKAQDAANIVFVDTVTKTVKLVRVGADTDCYLRGRNLFSIKYTDKTVIANS